MTERLSRASYAALVIGSGFGGAVAACRLAQAGVDVAVVERGRRWVPGEFPRDLSRLDAGWLWTCGQGLYDARPLGDILTVCAAGYGGGSLVYANVAARPPAPVFDDAWPVGYTRGALDPYYDLVAHMLDVRPTPSNPATGREPVKTGLFREAAHRLGAGDGFFLPNVAVTFGDPERVRRNQFGREQAGCRFCGECDIGCNVGAKNTLDLTYLAEAENHGADVGVLTEAVSITRAPASGYRVRLREHPDADGARREREVTAGAVFVCAGALGSTELLLRCRDQHRTLPDLPAALGHGFSGNGDFLSFGRGTTAQAAPSAGPTITTATVLRADGVGRVNWFLVEDGGYSRHLARLVAGLDLARLPARAARAVGQRARRTLTAGRALAYDLADDGHAVVLLAMGRDSAQGRIELVGRRRRLRVRWDTPRNDPLYAAQRAASADAVRLLGGHPVDTPTWRLFRQPVTVHNLGGCRMSDDPARGVTGPDGQVHGHPGLYVLDGAALPGATGANPSMTIAAVAERCIERAVRRLTGDATWRAPETADVVRRPVPEDAAVDAVLAAAGPPIPARGPGVRFAERMRGRLPVPGVPEPARVGLRLTATATLTHLLADPDHTVALSGTVDVHGLTAGAADTSGSLRLLAPASGGATMDYRLAFTDAAGRPWTLTGRKDVSRRRGHGPWRATTSLTARLTPEGAEAGDAGALAIAPLDVGRLLLSLRPTGTGGPTVRWWAVVRFVRFFARTAASALLPHR